MKRFSILTLFVVLGCQNAQELKTEQYFAEGYQLYTTHCANCHQPDGSGTSNLYPPITQAALSKKDLLACIIKNGLKDTIIVDGRKFNRPMPANPKLTELEIAEIVTFVTVKWGRDSLYMPIEKVQAQLAACKL